MVLVRSPKRPAPPLNEEQATGEELPPPAKFAASASPAFASGGTRLLARPRGAGGERGRTLRCVENADASSQRPRTREGAVFQRQSETSSPQRPPPRLSLQATPATAPVKEADREASKGASPTAREPEADQQQPRLNSSEGQRDGGAEREEEDQDGKEKRLSEPDELLAIQPSAEAAAVSADCVAAVTFTGEAEEDSRDAEENALCVSQEAGDSEEDESADGIPRGAAALERLWVERQKALLSRLSDISTENRAIQKLREIEDASRSAIASAAEAAARQRSERRTELSKALAERREAAKTLAESEAHFATLQEEATAAAGGADQLRRRLVQTQKKKQRLNELTLEKHEQLSRLRRSEAKAQQLLEVIHQLKRQALSDVETARQAEALLALCCRFRVSKVQGEELVGLVVPEEPPSASPRKSQTPVPNAASPGSCYSALPDCPAFSAGADECAAIVKLRLPTDSEPRAEAEAAEALWLQLQGQVKAADIQASKVLDAIRARCKDTPR